MKWGCFTVEGSTGRRRLSQDTVAKSSAFSRSHRTVQLETFHAQAAFAPCDLMGPSLRLKAPSPASCNTTDRLFSVSLRYCFLSAAPETEPLRLAGFCSCLL